MRTTLDKLRDVTEGSARLGFVGADDEFDLLCEARDLVAAFEEERDRLRAAVDRMRLVALSWRQAIEETSDRRSIPSRGTYDLWLAHIEDGLTLAEAAWPFRKETLPPGPQD